MNFDEPAIVKPTAAIEQMLRETEVLVARRYSSLRCLVILVDGSILCAQAFQSRARRQSGDRDPALPAPVYSVTKSVSALLIGQLIDRGLIKSVDQPLAELLGSYSADLDSNPYMAQLSLHRLLSMTAGLLWRNARAGLEPMVSRMMQHPDWVRFALSLPVARDKAGQFQYNSAVSHLLSAIVEEACGQTAASFADQHLFQPLGIEQFSWQADSTGRSIGGWGLSLSPLSMARIGQLCIDRGLHKGGRLVSANWIEKMWTRYSDAQSIHAANQPADYRAAGYGYQWWLRGNDDIELYCAEGLGGQLVCCHPAARAVIVASCDYPGRRASLWPLLERYWLPAVGA